ncbi:hypothetical protein BDN71DRAFT_1586921 [Pleurotus eryngii]|uniref:Uncharacterized protein n=1 Tax=Pleurotus eryngii TaxID=5323 RepID=A0A9P6A7I9_PLEER|nr:hypothetical protein BDN71DRAFT_1586921 [Pleurotus eryngii]
MHIQFRLRPSLAMPQASQQSARRAHPPGSLQPAPPVQPPSVQTMLHVPGANFTTTNWPAPPRNVCAPCGAAVSTDQPVPFGQDLHSVLAYEVCECAGTSVTDAKPLWSCFVSPGPCLPAPLHSVPGFLVLAPSEFIVSSYAGCGCTVPSHALCPSHFFDHASFGSRLRLSGSTSTLNVSTYNINPSEKSVVPNRPVAVVTRQVDLRRDVNASFTFDLRSPQVQRTTAATRDAQSNNRRLYQHTITMRVAASNLSSLPPSSPPRRLQYRISSACPALRHRVYHVANPQAAQDTYLQAPGSRRQ